MKTLHARQEALADPFYQLEVLRGHERTTAPLPRFEESLASIGLHPLRPTKTEIFQVNVGYMCNQTCSHCHVDAGPDRKEIMTRTTMLHCLEALDKSDIETVDLTGGAPEMNPDFRWFVEQLSQRGKRIIVRSNLTIIRSNKKYYDLPQFFKRHNVEVISSLPCYTEELTDKQRGDGVFQKSIKALQTLNEAGYGVEGSGLKLNLVYNPVGAFLPGDQQQLEQDYKRELGSKFGIQFNELLVITNMPISRYLDYLLEIGKYEHYMEKLVNAFNPSAAANVMCRNTVSVGWDGRLYDCDFNQMLELQVESSAPQHISDFDLNALDTREIILNQHCYGCTAGAGSSCSGTIAS